MLNLPVAKLGAVFVKIFKAVPKVHTKNLVCKAYIPSKAETLYAGKLEKTSFSITAIK